MKRLAVHLIFLGVAVTHGIVLASPVTFKFVMPKFNYNQDSSLFGTQMDALVTVDNGTNNTWSTSFNPDNITALSFLSVDGAFKETANITNTSWIFNPSGSSYVPMITTDSLGIPTIHLGTQLDASGHYSSGTIIVSNPSLGISMGLSQGNPQLDTLVINVGDSGQRAYYDNAIGAPVGQAYSIDIVGTVAGSPQPTPEPGSYAMMLVGLGLIGVVVKQRSKTT